MQTIAGEHRPIAADNNSAGRQRVDRTVKPAVWNCRPRARGIIRGPRKVAPPSLRLPYHSMKNLRPFGRNSLKIGYTATGNKHFRGKDIVRGN